MWLLKLSWTVSTVKLICIERGQFCTKCMLIIISFTYMQIAEECLDAICLATQFRLYFTLCRCFTNCAIYLRRFSSCKSGTILLWIYQINSMSDQPYSAAKTGIKLILTSVLHTQAGLLCFCLSDFVKPHCWKYSCINSNYTITHAQNISTAAELYNIFTNYFPSRKYEWPSFQSIILQDWHPVIPVLTNTNLTWLCASTAIRPRFLF